MTYKEGMGMYNTEVKELYLKTLSNSKVAKCYLNKLEPFEINLGKDFGEFTDKEVKESVGILTMESKDMEESIRQIVDKLNAKGYKVKYASPGHNNLRKKEDHEPDGVYYGKLYSDARIMFDDKYVSWENGDIIDYSSVGIFSASDYISIFPNVTINITKTGYVRIVDTSSTSWKTYRLG